MVLRLPAPTMQAPEASECIPCRDLKHGMYSLQALGTSKCIQHSHSQLVGAHLAEFGFLKRRSLLCFAVTNMKSYSIQLTNSQYNSGQNGAQLPITLVI